MAYTDEEVEAQRAVVEKLRGQVLDADAKTAERQADAQREIEMAQLKAEEARLQAELDAKKEAQKVANVKDAASGPLDQAKEQQKQAEDAAAAAAEARNDKE
jgi:hypothetical protein